MLHKRESTILQQSSEDSRRKRKNFRKPERRSTPNHEPIYTRIFLARRSLGVGGGPHFCSRNITEDVRKFAAQQGVSEQQALQKGLQEKSREFVEQGSELYAKT